MKSSKRSGQKIRRSVLLCALAVSLASLPFPVSAAPPDSPRVAHVFVALADNVNQGIVPVPAKIGNGQDPANNLYWGAAFGVKSYFRTSPGWVQIQCGAGPKPSVMERCVFRNEKSNFFVVADAYDGSQIRQTVTDFLSAAARLEKEILALKTKSGDVRLEIGGASEVIAYVGHDAFMDFNIPKISARLDEHRPKVIILACASKPYFGPYLRVTGSEPILWTTGLMAPEAYSLRAALEGVIDGENGEQIRQRAAVAYDKFQKCGLRGAQRLFATGW
jgi:hypothetical protein